LIDAPNARDPRKRHPIPIEENRPDALTRYRVVERFGGSSLVEARPKTGRTHQIRVHLAAIGHPIIGDKLYGRASALVPRQFLHAQRIVFTHPSSGETMSLEAPLAPDLQAALDRLRRG
jgi:23S rRNA pseudouridine1911/1915/1917 synthase